MTDCVIYRRWLSPYVDGQLSAEERARLAAHLGACAACRAELEGLQAMLQTLRTLAPPEPPALLPGIHQQLQAGPWWQALARRFAAPWPVSLPLHGLALATTALLIVVISLPNVMKRAHVGYKQQARLSARTADGTRLQEGEATARGRSTARFLAGHKVDQNRKLAAAKEGLMEKGFTSDQPIAQAGTELAVELVAAPAASLSSVSTLNRVASSKDKKDSQDEAQIKRNAETTNLAPGPLQARWEVEDVAAASAQVIGWVTSRHGFAVATSDTHLSITLPSTELLAFLQQFASDPLPEAGALAPAEAWPGTPLWVTISLDLVLTP